MTRIQKAPVRSGPENFPCHWFLRLFCGLLISVSWLLLGVSSSGAQQPKAGEFQVKAAYLYNFAKFVEWPDQNSVDKNSPFEICVLGVDPFQGALDAAVAGESIDGKRVVPKRISKPQDVNSCRILFISSSEEQHLRDILTTLDKTRVLTVSDIPHFSELGGMIGFVLEGNRVRFDVNLSSAREAGLVLSSQLLKVATNVRNSSQSGDL
jgi:YfiR/HmsC-like